MKEEAPQQEKSPSERYEELLFNLMGYERGKGKEITQRYLWGEEKLPPLLTEGLVREMRELKESGVVGAEGMSRHELTERVADQLAKEMKDIEKTFDPDRAAELKENAKVKLNELERTSLKK